MENNLNQDNITPTSNEGSGGEEVKKDFQGLLGSIKKFLSELLDIRTNTDQQATKEAIIADIPFKGHTSWILICSIFIASIGLNANSTAVVIGAMLISPLMGPILGIGMSVAINDIDTLKRSLKNFAVMVVLSVITAYLFFRFFPLRDESSELLARTAPDIRDVLIAFFGGLALVIARAKKGTIASVIFGVAIATALMPPLCTVGFGLAIGNWSYATGALYLFTINTIFIALATFLVIKLLRFPMVRYVNSQRRRLISRLASLLAILVMIPAGITFYSVFQKSLFMRDAGSFIDEKIVPYQFTGEGKFLKDFSEIVYSDKDNSKIELVFMGNETIPDNVIATWENQMQEYQQLKGIDLVVVQGSKSDEANELKYVNELYESQKSILSNKDERIKFLETELLRLNQISSNQIPFNEISLEAKTNYENLERMGYAYLISTDFNKTDSIPLFEVTWKKDANRSETVKDMTKLQEWLRLRLNNKNIQIKEMPKD
ncbi:uncharacterized hydrophobic domain-containing protein [Maribacter sedimenticola]|uniref:Uncharacterized hydrophobic domain-containing protein n=1 Tax=Maribacter sedimenticola TaxID=228956 RepID=A0ABY1SMC5_9FLAO|nr:MULTISPECIES: DUF389 domain-containing protein [Maribacter]TVZ15369.1 putative hydrophobic protein (TIGR00271 family) [Maribacter sp. MAR_2009_72]SNR81368.1 uncharacterized hydrophobic domain-containing protein [Maribacter sedimenticola]